MKKIIGTSSRSPKLLVICFGNVLRRPMSCVCVWASVRSSMRSLNRTSASVNSIHSPCAACAMRQQACCLPAQPGGQRHGLDELQPIVLGRDA
jgi:hypothetical protein